MNCYFFRLQWKPPASSPLHTLPLCITPLQIAHQLGLKFLKPPLGSTDLVQSCFNKFSNMIFTRVG